MLFLITLLSLLSPLLVVSTATQQTLLPTSDSHLQSDQQTLPASFNAPFPQYDRKNWQTPYLLNLHKSLVSTPSVTGSEQRLTDALITHLQSLNFTVETQAVQDPDIPNNSTHGKRRNIYAYPSDCDRKTPVCLTSHIDTVPPFFPYSRTASEFDDTPITNDDLASLLSPPTSVSGDLKPLPNSITLHGRGSADDCASLSSQITALLSLLHSKSIPPCSTSLLFVLSEETNGSGMKTTNTDHMNPGWKAVVFGEPTENRLAAGHKGLAAFRLEVEGESGHSGYPWLSVSANDLLVAALGGVRDLAEGRLERGLPRSEKYGNTTVNVGKIEGGVAANVIAEKAEASAAMRLAGGPLEDVHVAVEGAIADSTREMVEKARREGKHATVDVVWSSLGYPPVGTDTDVTVWEVDDGETGEIDEGRQLGNRGDFTVNYGTDVPNLQGDHKRYLYGPGSILVAHGAHERISVGELMEGWKGYESLLKSVLRNLDENEDGREL